MKKILFQLFTFIGILASSSAFAQNVEFEKANFPGQKDKLKEALANIKVADHYWDEGPDHYYHALDFYLNAYSFNPNNAMLNYKIGSCYLISHTHNKAKAVPFLEKANQLQPKITSEVHYKLGRGYHLTMKWDKAIDEYNIYKRTLTATNLETQIKIEDVNKKIQECNNGKELEKTPARVFIDNLGKIVNTNHAEYTPVISADEDMMFFTSRREGSTGGEHTDDGEFLEDIYIMYKDKDGHWGHPANIGEPINTNGHDATVGLSPDGQKLLVYKDDGGDGNIYECKLKGDKWSKPEKMSKHINSSAHESSATFSFDGKILYFVSEREGGVGNKEKGNRDIYYTTLNEKGKWGPATNIGPTLNTQYGEEGVYMMPDGKTLYFSSQGFNSMGGYDIFKTVLDHGKWTAPENLGYPVNGPDDDVFFVVGASGKHGYYSGIHDDGFGEKDLLKVTFLGAEKPFIMSTEDNLLASLAAPVSETEMKKVDIQSNLVTILKGHITDEFTQKPVEANIQLFDNSLGEEVAAFTSNSTTGKYLISLPAGKNYAIVVKAEGYLFHSENVDVPIGATYQEIIKDIALKSLKVGSKIVLRNIFFDFGKATLKPESKHELDRLHDLLVQNPGLKIEVSGHTDNKSSAAFNQTLSQNRAAAVVDYLVKAGIDKGRMVPKGYGLTKPMATNATDAGRALNRRTEFEIISNN